MDIETDEIVAVDGSLSVLGPKGTAKVLPTPEGVTDAAFRRIVSAADALWHIHGRMPVYDEVKALVPHDTHAAVATAMQSPSFASALETRGAVVGTAPGLTPAQAAAITLLSDFGDKRSTGTKLKSLGVPMSTFQAWQKQPLFAQHYTRRVEDVFANASTLALTALMQNVEAGDQRAIEKTLEITGRWNPAQQQIEDVRGILQRIVEAIIRNVPDPAQRQAILGDIQGAVASYTMLTREIER